ncbi:MAG: lamin tail domain-containing protein [Parcubacteria group bacterium]|nr:lamin tail domain-containing protein [Parcubacteria group bacterium]
MVQWKGMKNHRTNALMPLDVLVLALAGGFFVWAGSAAAAASDIIFTEIMYNPSGTDTKTEWVEIFNSGPSDVTLIEGSGNDSWRFNDGSNHTLTLIQGSLTVPAGGYAILASDGTTFLDAHQGYVGTVIDTVMSLNNTSDTIQLSSDKGESFFSGVTYENTQGADGDGNSLQLLNGTWVAAGETLGSSAVESAQSEQQETQGSTGSGSSGSSGSSGGTPGSSASPAATPQGDPGKVKITEIFPNPEGDENNEFIELWNNQDQSISLEGWKIADTAKIKTLAGITLVPGEYYALYRSSTGIALNNTSETIYLYDANGNLIDTHAYQSTIEGYSLSLDKVLDAFLWSGTKTPSRENSITTPNEPPVPEITFERNPVAPRETVRISGLDSTDPDDDELSYFWTIGTSFQASGPAFAYAFDELGKHLIYVTVSDGTHDVAATATIDVIDAIDVVSLRSTQSSSSVPAPADARVQAAQSPTATTTGQIFITEIFPNPAGRDDGEWVELYNPNGFGIILGGWVIDDEDAGSRPHTIKERTIGPQSYLILGKEETKLTLNNTSDEVRLFDASNTLIDEVRYDDAQEDESYTKSDDDFWYWSTNKTPGEPNTGSGRDAPVGADAFGQSVSAADGVETATPYDVVDIDLPNIRELELGTEVRVQGTVAVEPGVLAKTYFYITGSPGIQVYFSKKEPEANLGLKLRPKKTL